LRDRREPAAEVWRQRRREIAIGARSAGRRRIVSQLLIESLIRAACGAGNPAGA
jgi:hypothetical protein